MSRLNLMLVLALIASALVLINTAYEARALFTELDRAQREERTLTADYHRLDAERQAAATNLRVERVAREKLQMRNATAGVTQYVDEAAVAASGSGK